MKQEYETIIDYKRMLVVAVVLSEGTGISIKLYQATKITKL